MDLEKKDNDNSEDIISEILNDTDEDIQDIDAATENENQDEEPITEEFTETTGGINSFFYNIKENISEQINDAWEDYKEESDYKKRERRNAFYNGKPPEDKKMRMLYITLFLVKKIFSLAVTTVFSILLIFILTGTVVGTAATVYVLSFMDTTPTVALKAVNESFASYIYTMNKATNEYELVYKVMPQSHDICLATDITALPDYVKYAFVCIEDERFYSHEGVDYKRTGAAIANLALSQIQQDREKFGGSTITQQLIKNVTMDNENSWQRKMREIFTAMKFEKKYTKDEILEAYLNTIYFDQIDTYNMLGIEAASIGYFGKSASELTIAEAACLAAIPKSPNTFNPTVDYEANMYRKEIVLGKMFELGVITADQYEDAINQQILVTTMPEFQAKYPIYTKLTENDDEFKNPDLNSWGVDTAIYEFADYLVEKNDLETRQDGINMFNNGGYKLYLTVDSDVQAHLDSTFADWTYFPEEYGSYINEKGEEVNEMVQASCAVMDYHGRILGLAGQIGPKTINLGWNNAYSTHRQPGSTIKPVTTYGYGIENDKITWSSYFYDKALPAGVAMENEWPNNYSGRPSGNWYPVNYFLKRSLNTLPAQIAYTYGLQNVFDFATQKLHLDLNPDWDVDYSPICVGGTHTGPTVINLANAYMPYGNGGTYYKASVIAQAVDCKTDEVIFDNEASSGEPAVSDETAYVMNKLLQKVITDGTGTAAQLSNTTLAGKTGTTEDWRDITFVGLTPDHVSALWVGYPTGRNARAIENANSARIWYNVFGTYANATATDATFPECDTVIKARYCSSTGLLANAGCPGGDYGYYKSSNCAYCTTHR